MSRIHPFENLLDSDKILESAEVASEIRSLLTQLLLYLEQESGEGAQFWAEKIREVLAQDGIDPNKILWWFGGTGSFNDFIGGLEVKLSTSTPRPDRSNMPLSPLVHDLWRLSWAVSRAQARTTRG